MGYIIAQDSYIYSGHTIVSWELRDFLIVVYQITLETKEENYWKET